MRKQRPKKATRKVDRLLGRHSDQTAGSLAREFEWTHSIESPAQNRTTGKNPARSRLPRTRE
jgi:hypothetical protein